MAEIKLIIWVHILTDFFFFCEAKFFFQFSDMAHQFNAYYDSCSVVIKIDGKPKIYLNL